MMRAQPSSTYGAKPFMYSLSPTPSGTGGRGWGREEEGGGCCHSAERQRKAKSRRIAGGKQEDRAKSAEEGGRSEVEQRGETGGHVS
eukprot:3609804-Rhodomonas_salina.4